MSFMGKFAFPMDWRKAQEACFSCVYHDEEDVKQEPACFQKCSYYLQLKSNRNEKNFRKENKAAGALYYTDLKFLDNNSFL